MGQPKNFLEKQPINGSRRTPHSSFFGQNFTQASIYDHLRHLLSAINPESRNKPRIFPFLAPMSGASRHQHSCHQYSCPLSHQCALQQLLLAGEQGTQLGTGRPQCLFLACEWDGKNVVAASLQYASSHILSPSTQLYSPFLLAPGTPTDTCN